MKQIVKKSISVFLFFGLIAISQSCEEKQPETQNSLIQELTPNSGNHFKSDALTSEQFVKVTDCNLKIWQRFGAPGATGTIKFIDEPSNLLLGKGSVQFNCPDQVLIRLQSNSFNGTKLSAITTLSYSTFVQQIGSVSDNIFIVIQLDIDNDGIVDFPVVFNPIFQTGAYVEGKGPDQGPSLKNVWQTWNLLSGVWWRGPGPDPWNGGVLFTLASLLNQYPNCTITNQGDGPGSLRIGGGAPYFSGPFIGYADNFRIGINGVTTIFDFEKTTVNAGEDQKVIYGFGSNCATLTGTASGGFEPYTYSWEPGGSTPDQASTEVCPTVTTTYTLTVTDANGCSRTDDVTVFVNDVRCGHNMDKVKICHKGIAICIESKDVEEHLAHGDILGDCQTNPN